MWKEFKEFALNGSVLDLAIGIIIGGAFGNIVQSLVKDIIMPPIGLLLKGVDFSNLFVALDGKSYSNLADAQKAGAPVLAYGNFFNTVIVFIIVAFVLFLIIRQVNRLKKQPVVTPNTKECPYCLSTIPLKATRCPACTSEIEPLLDNQPAH
jgi:large conductance mechanosensitive channel